MYVNSNLYSTGFLTLCLLSYILEIKLQLMTPWTLPAPGNFKISRIFYGFFKIFINFTRFFLFFSSDSSDEDDDSEEDTNLAPPKLAPVSKGMCHNNIFEKFHEIDFMEKHSRVRNC